jgi:hypothetical protein
MAANTMFCTTAEEAVGYGGKLSKCHDTLEVTLSNVRLQNFGYGKKAVIMMLLYATIKASVKIPK